MSNFRIWSLAKLNKRFSLRRLEEMEEMTAWEKAVFDIPPNDHYFLQRIQRSLKDNVFFWNESELVQHFIGPLLMWVEFNTPYSNLFNERPFSAIVDGEELNGEPDAMIASGHDEPEKPYFCFHEYKREIDASGDPSGQCLAAMLAAQAINENRHPVFGIYVVGQNWYFVVLKGKDYTISSSFSAVSDEIFHIYQRLLWLKQTILAWIIEDMKL